MGDCFESGYTGFFSAEPVCKSEQVQTEEEFSSLNPSQSETDFMIEFRIFVCELRKKHNVEVSRAIVFIQQTINELKRVDSRLRGEKKKE